MNEYKYQEQVEAAKRWLGDRYLLAKPVNAHYKTPMFLRKQA